MSLTELNAILHLKIGEMKFVREPRLDFGTFHRYRDGWHFFKDVTDRLPCGRAFIGYTFTDAQDVADFLNGDLRPLINYALIGERIEA